MNAFTSQVSDLSVIKIDKNITPPKGIGKIGRFPFREMKVGDSFAVPKDEKPNNVRSLASLMGNKMNARFSVRQYKGGYRCWRIS